LVPVPVAVTIGAASAEGPVGSVTSRSGYIPYQSLHHSHALPTRSYSPQALGL
jgi:hypothetical protein